MKKLIALIALTAAGICWADNTNQTAEIPAPPEPTETTFAEIEDDAATGREMVTISPEPTPINEIHWQAPDATLKLTIQTNPAPRWVNLEKFAETRGGQPVWRVEQLGFIHTNRVLTIIQEGRSTNEVVLKELHKPKLPTTNRTVYATRK